MESPAEAGVWAELGNLWKNEEHNKLEGIVRKCNFYLVKYNRIYFPCFSLIYETKYI